MFSLLLCLALAALTFAAPPIVPVENEVDNKDYPCVDGVNNVAEIGDIETPTAKVFSEKIIAYLYDDKDQPSCYKGRAKLSMPGILKLKKG
ncbi:hypothetical protein OESDEN_16147 [Oesophagostomum dentatum]|uniref:Transthyretin-like family protein n=1 Tax=Oesophagostomum dentatum TaxID=61180 RepID=A0A0B1SFT2_OESDE|nr:hypothetical protein OESDEN_16147 [Oesophagostomum dentatum]